MKDEEQQLEGEKELEGWRAVLLFLLFVGICGAWIWFFVWLAFYGGWYSILAFFYAHTDPTIVVSILVAGAILGVAWMAITNR